MLKSQIIEDLKKAVEELGYQATDIEVYIPKNMEFGEYSSNVALQLAKQDLSSSKQSPIDIANKIIEKLKSLNSFKDDFQEINVAGGFINFYLTTDALMKNIHQVCNYSNMVNSQTDVGNQDTKKILLEYAQPNTHKAFHIGHTRNITLGESLARILESQGNKIYRCTYGSDIGLPIAKALWGVLNLEKEYKQIQKRSLKEKAQFLGKAYAKGALAYEDDQVAKSEIDEINKKLYSRDKKVLKIWEETRQWSLDYLEAIYQTLGTKFDGIFVESQVEERGKEVVLKNIGGIFEEEGGAVIFPGEKHGLHNRVFITQAGNPTYEAKELGLAEFEYQSFDYDRAIHVVDVTQSGYFEVVIKVIDMLFPDLASKKEHLSYGFVNLKGGKMSSRTGDVVTFDYLFDEVKNKVKKIMDNSSVKQIATPRQGEARNDDQVIDIVSIGAIKFTMLKYSPQTKIYFDLEKSVALDGDSGPYIQYCYARAKSVLRLANYNYQPEITPGVLEIEEKSLLKKIEVFPTIVSEAAEGLNPTLIASFLLELSKDFNLFYQKHQIIKAEEKSEFRLALTCSVAVILKQGLYLLGIEAPERM